MYQFACAHLVPGCTTVETADTKEEAFEKATKHIREHHPHHELLDEIDKGFDQRIYEGIMMIPR